MDGFIHYSMKPYTYVPAMASTEGILLCQSPCPFQGQPGHDVSQFPNVNMGFPTHRFGIGHTFAQTQFVSPTYPTGGMVTFPQFQSAFPSSQGPDWNSNNLIGPIQYNYSGTMDNSGLYLPPAGNFQGPAISRLESSAVAIGDKIVTSCSMVPIYPAGNEGQLPLSQDHSQEGPNLQQWTHAGLSPQGVTDQFVDPRGPYNKTMQNTRNGVRLSRGKPKGKYGCGFCFRDKDTYRFSTTHQLRNVHGEVTCPILKVYICPICGQTGKSAHTVRYCPSKWSLPITASRHLVSTNFPEIQMEGDYYF